MNSATSRDILDVHRIRFYDYKPQAISYVTYCKELSLLALVRSNQVIEIWTKNYHWVKEKTIYPEVENENDIESLFWCNSKLYAAGQHGFILQYDLKEVEISQRINSNTGCIRCTAVNSDDSQVALGTEDGCIVLYSATFESLAFEKFFSRITGQILCISWYPDDSKIAASGSGDICIWIVESGSIFQRILLPKQGQNDFLVRSIGVAKDFTIVTGDSRGKISFWNETHGTLITSFQSHKAAILSLVFNQLRDTVFAAGTDPALIEYRLVPIHSYGDTFRWVERSSGLKKHTHEIRSMTFISNTTLVSGGVDCHLMTHKFYPSDDAEYDSKKSFIQTSNAIFPVPYNSIVKGLKLNHLQRIIGLKYDFLIEIWRLSPDADPVKLVNINAKKGHFISCFALTLLADSELLLAYSTSSNTKLFRISVADENNLKVEQITPLLPLPVAIELKFSYDASQLIIANKQGSSFSVVHGLTQSKTTDCFPLNTMQYPEDILNDMDVVHVIAVGKKYIAFADLAKNILIYFINSDAFQFQCQFPKSQYHVTAMSFSQHNENLLVVAYSNNNISEFDCSTEHYTDWSLKVADNWPTQFMNRISVFRFISYHPTYQNMLLLADDSDLILLDKDIEFPAVDENIYAPSTKEKALKFVKNKYKFLLDVMCLENTSELVVVHERRDNFYAKLPKPFESKRFLV